MTNKFLTLIEYITLNIASFGWVLIDINTPDIQEVAEQFDSPNWVTTLVGLSIVFFNIARGISHIKNKKND
jgi:hypothetical protein